MPLVKNVSAHVDDLHTGTPIEAYGTAEINAKDLQLEHYQARIRSGLMLVVPEPEHQEPGLPLDGLSVAELRECASAAGVELPRNAKKAQIIDALREHANPKED